MEEKPTRRLHVDMMDLEEAFQNPFPESFSYYLDLETGAVEQVSVEARAEMEDIYAEIGDLGEMDEVEIETALKHELDQRNMPDWMKQDRLQADRIEAGYNARYISIPHLESYEGYDDMEEFVATVQDSHLRNQLANAIRGKGAFRRFKDVLAGNFHERERWFAFQDDQVRRRIVDWLNSEGIEPIFEPLPVPPPVRPQLLTAVLTFVRAARDVPGVTRIALIGSLATNEPSPKDVDLLVTVTAEANLPRLATLGRKLNAQAQSGIGRSGEVFLADPSGTYLGRLCQWKECGPGLHRDCDAQHCGQRPYLHDDLQSIQLARELIATPPLVLWPQVVANDTLPEDAQKALAEPLRREEK